MAPKKRNTRSTPPSGRHQPPPRRPSWFQRFGRRMSTPFRGEFWQRMQSRNTTNTALETTEQPVVRDRASTPQHKDEETDSNASIAARIAQMGRRISTPFQNSRPRTAPPRNISFHLRPIRYIIFGEDDDESQKRCPYDPTVLQSFPNPEEFEPPFCPPWIPWPTVTRSKPLTPCDDCRLGTERAHINLSPSRFSRRRSRTQQSRRVSVPKNRTADQDSSELHSRGTSTAQNALVPRQRLLDNLDDGSPPRSPPARPPERMGFRPDENMDTFNELRTVVERKYRGPPIPAPQIHRISPDVAFVHRNEVVAHLDAMREGRHTPLSEYQAQSSSDINVVGYTLDHARHDGSAAALYSEGVVPGEYLPSAPRPVPSPDHVLSPFRREYISLAPVPRPVLISRLDEPPFRPALPAGTILLHPSEWGRPRETQSAPEAFERVLRHSSVYRMRNAHHQPRVPSPLREQHGPSSFEESSDSEGSSWSHGTMPWGEDEHGEVPRRKVNGIKKKPNIRGGGADDERTLWEESTLVSDEEVAEWDEARKSGAEYMLEFVPQGRNDSLRTPLVKDVLLDMCMQPTTQVPRLRGGAGKHDRSNRVPASLFYLAGATGRKPGESITVRGWNSMKPKKRMGGLFGMAVFGNKAGKPYIPETRDQEVQTDPEANNVCGNGPTQTSSTSWPPPIPVAGLAAEYYAGAREQIAPPVASPTRQASPAPASTPASNPTGKGEVDPGTTKTPTPVQEEVTIDAPAGTPGNAPGNGAAPSAATPKAAPNGDTGPTPGGAANDAAIPAPEGATNDTEDPAPRDAASHDANPAPNDANPAPKNAAPYPTTPLGGENATDGANVQMPVTPPPNATAALLNEVLEEFRQRLEELRRQA